MNDSTFHALADEQRRALLLSLLESNPQDQGFESLTGDAALAEAERRTQVAMYHNHLPQLEDYGYIEWNKDAQEVVKGPRFEEIRPLLEWMDSQAELAGQSSQFK